MATDLNFKNSLDKKQKMELEDSGIEYEESIDELQEESEYPKDNYIDNIKIDQKILSLYQVCRWIDDGDLNLQPEYQRDCVWSLKKKSLLIESLLLKIPIPSFYFDQDKEEKKAVIDGLQRLSTVHDFMNNKFKLRGVSYLKDCEGKVFSELERKYRRRIEDTQFMIYILDQQCPEMVKFDVFRRVNTGGVQLNDQEIRNVGAAPETRELLRKMAQSEEFLLATHEKINPMRMLDKEMCLKFIAFLKRYDSKQGYPKNDGTLTSMLDAEIIQLNLENEEQKQVWLEIFKLSMRKCYALFGENTFIKVKERRVINRALFTAFGIEIWYRSREQGFEDECLEKKRAKANEILECLFKEKKYNDAFTFSTSNQENIKLQFELARQVLEGIND